MSVKRGESVSAARRAPWTLTSGALALLALWLFVPQARAATEIPKAPTRWVTDNAGFLSADTRAALDQRLETYERQTGHQVLVWIGTTLNGVPIEDFAVHAFAKWRVGRKGIDDGLVLFIFAQDRKMRIEVGYGLEDRVPDVIASRIIRDAIAPPLQAGNRDAALSAGVEAIVEAIDRGVGATGAAGEEGGSQAARTPYAGAQRATPAATLGQKIVIGIVVLVFLVILVTHPSLALWILFNMLAGGGGRGGGGGFGGSSFGGGGGRSGGGGASGSW
jgi:uncharacterized protein